MPQRILFSLFFISALFLFSSTVSAQDGSYDGSYDSSYDGSYDSSYDSSYDGSYDSGSNQGGEVTVNSAVNNADGSTTFNYSDGGSGTWYPDGGSLLQYSDGTAMSVSPSGQSNINNNGTITAHDIDGTITTFTPDLNIFIQSPDGTTISGSPDKTTTTFADGRTTTTFADGRTITTFTDGTTNSVFRDLTYSTDGRTTINLLGTPPAGTITYDDPDGTIHNRFPDGTTYVISPDGTRTSTHADGSTNIRSPDGTITTTDYHGYTDIVSPNGTITTIQPNGFTAIQSPDGTLTMTNLDGETRIRFPDGSVERRDASGALIGSAETSIVGEELQRFSYNTPETAFGSNAACCGGPVAFLLGEYVYYNSYTYIYEYQIRPDSTSNDASFGTVSPELPAMSTTPPPGTVEPDLISVDLASSGTRVVGSTITFSGNIKNQGGSAAFSSTARFCMDNPNCLTATTGELGTDLGVPVLIAGETSSSFSRTWVATPGTHIVYLCADVGDVVTEWSETNNCSQMAVVLPTIADFPDLISVNLASSGILVVGNVITFSGNIKNQGGTSAPASSARFCIDNANCLTSSNGRLGADQSVPTLAGGVSSVSLSRPWTAIAGSHTAYLCADVGDVVTEWNEANNCSQLTVVVVFSPGTVTIVGWPGVIPGFPGTGATVILVPFGGTALIEWNTENTASCTVSGTNGDLWTGISSSRTTVPIFETTTYAIACIDLNGDSTPTQSITIQLKPQFKEF